MSSRKKALAFITAAVMLCGNTAVFPAAADAEGTAVTFTESGTVSVDFTSADDRIFANHGDNDYPILNDDRKKAIAAKIDPDSTFDIFVKDITVTYDYSFTAVDNESVQPNDADIRLYVFGGGAKTDETEADLHFGQDESNEVSLADSLTGTNKTVTFSSLGGNAADITNIWHCSLGIGGNGKAGDSLTLTVKSIVYTVEYEKVYDSIYKAYSEYSGSEAVKITYDISRVGECGHADHVADDGVDYNANDTYCPWAQIYVHRVSGSGVWSEGYAAGEFGTNKPNQVVTVLLKDIFAVTGTPAAGEQLVFSGNQQAVPTNVEIIDKFKLPDLDLNTGSVVSGTIEEEKEWTPDGEKPTGKPNLSIGSIALAERAAETKFEGYNALQIEYTVSNINALSAINVVLHGWEDNSVGWDSTYYAISSSGTVTIDLTKYKDKTYHNIYVNPIAPAASSIGDSLAPGFTVTSAKLLTEYYGVFSSAIQEIKPVEVQPSNPSAPSVPSTPPSPSADSQTVSSSVTGTTEKAVEEINGAAAGSTVEISLKGNTVADKEILIAVAGKDIDIKVTVSGGVTIEINGKDVENAKNVNLGVKMNSKAINEKRINEIAENKDTVQFSLKHNGDFGFKAKFNLPVNKKYNGKYANIYWDNRGMLEFVGSSYVNSGTVSYVATHASDYVMIFDDYAYGEDISSAAGTYADSESNENVPYIVVAAFVMISGITAVTVKRFIVKSK